MHFQSRSRISITCILLFLLNFIPFNYLFAADFEITNQEKQEILANKIKIGKGASGNVYEITFKGNIFALKESFDISSLHWEYNSLKQLQHTNASNAVIKVFAQFDLDGKAYYLMERGVKSLEQAIKDSDDIPVDKLIDAAKNMQQLHQAYIDLKISNRDIKPANMVLMADNSIKTIDVSEHLASQGYDGTNGQLMARGLLSAFLKTHLNATMAAVKALPLTKDYAKAARGFIKYWLQSYCFKIGKITNQCHQINDFNDLYNLMNTNDMKELLTAGHTDAEREPLIDVNGYRTFLTLPQFIETNDIWAQYFEKQNYIGSKFCKDIGAYKAYRQTMSGDDDGIVPLSAFGERSFFATNDYDGYEGSCKRERDEEFGGYKYTHTPFQSNNEEFKIWIKHAYTPVIKADLWMALANLHKEDEVFKYLFDHVVKPKSDELYNELLKLYLLGLS